MAIDRSFMSGWIDDSGSGTDGTILDVADFDALLDAVDDEIAAAGGSVAGSTRAVAYHNTTQSINTATFTTLSFNSEDLDSGTVHDNATNNSRLTVPTGGDGGYLVKGRVNFATNTTGVRIAEILKNGGTVIANVRTIPATGGSTTTMEVSSVLALVATDYVELRAYQDSGGALNTGDATTRSIQNELAAVRLW
jgi:hypothetical protein